MPLSHHRKGRDLETKGIACPLSRSNDPKRRTHYTAEAISADDPDGPNKNWIGINQKLSNKLIEHFFETYQLDEIVSDYDTIKREVRLSASKLDFLVEDTYLEVKTPLVMSQVMYGASIRTKPITPFSYGSVHQTCQGAIGFPGGTRESRSPYGTSI